MINNKIFDDAYKGISFEPERRAEMEKSIYNGMIQNVRGLLFADRSEEKIDKRYVFFDQFSAIFEKKYIAYLQAKSRCMSTMITGPANFPAARNQKRFDTERKRYEEMMEYYNRKKQQVYKMLNPEARPIMAGDDDAVSRLEQKLEKAEKMHANMKAANRIIRGKQSQEEKISALISLELTEKTARKVLTMFNCFGHIGFDSFELSNSNARIRNMKQRLEKLKRDKGAVTKTKELSNGIMVEDCPADNRVRMFFPGKPDQETRTELKQNGFRWAPSLGCWQAYRNYRSLEFSKKAGGDLT